MPSLCRWYQDDKESTSVNEDRVKAKTMSIDKHDAPSGDSNLILVTSFLGSGFAPFALLSG